MWIYDTLSRSKREFSPMRGNTVRIYTCGPSVYAYSHIGNFRTYLFENVLVRYLRYKGCGVKRVMNITDVEDKAIAAANKEGLTLAQSQEGKISAFFSDWDALGMLRPDVVAKASEHVPEMVSLIRRICSKGYCITDKDGTYFNVRKFRAYGKLRGLKNPRYFGKIREDDYVKEGLRDFALWKRWTPSDGNARWKSPSGQGRPGWHIECSAIAMHYLGESFDIHCGGSDNIFPHHENEIAQSESATGKRYVNFWMHARHLTIGKRKMSKRIGNVFYVDQLAKEGASPLSIRHFLISGRYRSRLDFTAEKLKSQSAELARAWKTLAALRMPQETGGKCGNRLGRKLIRGFESAMDDDLDTNLAFRGIFRILKEAEELRRSGKLSREGAIGMLGAMRKIDSVLGVFF